MTTTMLDVKEHSRILDDFERICTVAGIQGRYLHSSMTEYCGGTEIDWVRKFKTYREAGCPGLVLEGVPKPDTRCQAIAAALVRNYVDARVIPLNTLLDQVGDGAPLSTVLLIPNFYLASLKRSMPAWRVQSIYDLLLTRSTQNKPTVVYVEDMSSLVSMYGVPFRDFLDSFRRVTE